MWSFVHHHTSDTRDQVEETAQLVREQGRHAVTAVGDLGNKTNVICMFDVYAVYTGGKAFMNGIVFTLAKELGGRGITVNWVSTFLGFTGCRLA